MLPRSLPLILVIVAATALSGCTELMIGSHLFKKGANSQGCTEEGYLKVGNPYLVDGTRYTPMTSSYNYREKGIASWYGDDFHGKSTANGECFNMYAFTAAHKTLPLPTIVRVTNLENNRSIVLKVNDRGPFVAGRLLDLSYAAAQSLDIARNGTAPVLVEAIGGPHNQPGGASGGGLFGNKAPERALPLGPRDRVAATLPTVVPTPVEEEDLGPVTPPAPVAKRSLPPVPDRADVPFTSTRPLEHTRVYVQVGAFADKARAQQELAKLKRRNPEGALAPLHKAGGAPLWRVRTGPFKTVAEAESVLAQVRDDGFNAAQIKVEKE